MGTTTETAARFIDALRSDPGNADLRQESIRVLGDLVSACKLADRLIQGARDNLLMVRTRTGNVLATYDAMASVEDGPNGPIFSADRAAAKRLGYDI